MDNTLQGVNKELGTNFGYMGTSGLGNLRANIDSAKRVSEMVNDLYAENDGFGKYESERFGGNGLYAGAGAKMLGEGLYAGSQRQPMRGQGTRVNVRQDFENADLSSHLRSKKLKKTKFFENKSFES